ncbi:MAG TPA: aminodeoxychorismate synthase component I [Gammaproteobacteria bacterium]|nr:aminodeoxychorismate synthase component I [Gammaproteobacteria bacterium]
MSAPAPHNCAAPAALLPALKRARPERYPFLLESTARGGSARYSILFASPGETLTLSQDFALSPLPQGDDCMDAGGRAMPGAIAEGRVRGSNRFLANLDDWWQAERIATATGNAEMPFRGGWFIYLGYELAGEIESVPLPPVDSALPIAFATRIPAAIIYDHQRDHYFPVAEPERADLLNALRDDLAHPPVLSGNAFRGPISHLTEAPADDYLQSVARAREFIHAGDVFQVNLARAWHGELVAGCEPGDIYARLRQANPAPFSGWANCGDGAIVSSSPERLVRVSGERVETRPIAGTRPRHADAARDNELMRQLMAHPKERAEHVMLIDLERNDLGRIARTGSVCVDEMMITESYAHVHHIVSNVSARLNPETTPGEVIRAVFPGGTITGCPKVRCMEIIAELEGTRRGPYTGAMGYLNRDGDMDLNILIRTLVVEGNRLSFRAGAGIVADSVPEFELEETRAKARGLLAALC